MKVLIPSLLMLFVAMVLFNRPITSVTSPFKKHGTEVVATVIGLNESAESVQTRRGTTDFSEYEITVRYEREQTTGGHTYTVPETVYIRNYVLRSTYRSLSVGDELDVVFIDGAAYETGVPRALPADTVNASIFTKFWLASRGNIADSGLGLIVGIFSVLGIFIGLLMMFGKPKEIGAAPRGGANA